MYIDERTIILLLLGLLLIVMSFLCKKAPQLFIYIPHFSFYIDLSGKRKSRWAWNWADFLGKEEAKEIVKSWDAKVSLVIGIFLLYLGIGSLVLSLLGKPSW